MDSTPKRLLAVIIALLVTVGIVKIVDRGNGEPDVKPSSTARLPTIGPAQCDQLPGKTKYPSWYRKDLPLPPGSYPAAVKIPGPASTSFPRAIFAVRGSLRDFVVHALQVWPKQGWILGRGEAEASEAEDNFYLPGTDIRGAFIARSTYCEAGWTWVYIVMGSGRAPRPTPKPSGSTTPLQ